ncbi:hypothetical protein ABLN87_14120 [Ruegeria sp. SCPT10]|uniref:hypothetical protein n=1 Tax=Ruegeria sp. SCP10 TaxID=3141377 RepID=UPI00333619E3
MRGIAALIKVWRSHGPSHHHAISQYKSLKINNKYQIVIVQRPDASIRTDSSNQLAQKALKCGDSVDLGSFNGHMLEIDSEGVCQHLTPMRMIWHYKTASAPKISALLGCVARSG